MKLAQHYLNTWFVVYVSAASQQILSMLAQRLRRCQNIETALADCPMFCGTAAEIL